MRGEKVDGLCIGGAKKKVIPGIGRWKRNKLRRRGCIVLASRSRICIVAEVDGLRIRGPKKKGHPKHRGEEGEKKPRRRICIVLKPRSRICIVLNGSTGLRDHDARSTDFGSGEPLTCP